jgi:hypothetical protein
MADLPVSLGERGTLGRPLARAGAATTAATRGGDGVAVSELARYGVQIDRRFAMRCAFTPNAVYDLTLSVIEIRANAVVMVVQRTGPTASDRPSIPCDPPSPARSRATGRVWLPAAADPAGRLNRPMFAEDSII